MAGKMLDEGGPAFPTEPNTQPGLYKHHGMSLRDWFAGQITAATVTNARNLGSLSAGERRDLFMDVARISYEIADAMLLARAEGQP